MSSDSLKTLFHAYSSGMVDLPASGRWIVAGIGAGLALPQGFGASLKLVQPFKPDHDALARSGFDVTPVWPEASGERFDGALILLGRHRGQNESWLWEAVSRLKPGAPVVVAGGKTEGVQSFAKRLKAAGLELETAAKHHGLAMMFRRPDDRASEHIFLPPAEENLVEGRFRTAPGMFSHDRVDAGSRLLAGHLPADLKGRAADFCSGWGYLSAELTERAQGISSVDLFEADHDALDAARQNLAGLGGRVSFHWADLAREKVARAYDVIVMNPPFHTGRAAEPGLGQAIIRTASDACKPGGTLLLVANRQLPYEAALSAGFRKVSMVAEDRTYKVIRATR
ncbi:MAG: class I SAM-dependent methyltransferase [Notoacmeibacter sp.]|nr:class I SAM-dependent methyltransferase [Notoacmeibacter sp.]MCC0032282.1 class I SAM-dependent methyltransferase [Brucellaceae bacterium]